MTKPNVLQELEWRGFVQQATPGVAAHFAKGPVTAYCGFDPTAPSLQLGNLMPLMLLANLQRAGHRPIVLMGGGTGLIGDPSGKAGERPLLSKEQIKQNLQHQRDQMARFLEFGAGPTAAQPFYFNAVVRWTGSAFARMPDVEKKIERLQDAAAIRKALRAKGAGGAR